MESTFTIADSSGAQLDQGAHRIVAAWIVDGNPIEYVGFDVEHVEFVGGGPS